MDLPTHPLLVLVDSNKNELKSMLTHYIDATVDNQFASLRNSIISMIQSGQIGPQQNHNVTTFGTTSSPPTQANTHQSSAHEYSIDTLTKAQEHHNNQLNMVSLANKINTDDQIKQEFIDAENRVEINDGNVAKCKNGICNSLRENCDNTSRDDTENEDKLFDTISHSSLETNQSIIPNDILPNPNKSINTKPLIKHECLEGSPIIPIPILDFKTDDDSEVQNDIAINKPGNSMILSPNEGQSTEPIPTDEFDDNDDYVGDDSDNNGGIEDDWYYPDRDGGANGVCCWDHPCKLPLDHDMSSEDEIGSDIEDNLDEAQLELDDKASNNTQQINIQNKEENVIDEGSVIERNIEQSGPSTSGLRSSTRKRIPTKAFEDTQLNVNSRTKSVQSKTLKKGKRKNKQKQTKAVGVVQLNPKSEKRTSDQSNESVKKVKLEMAILELDCTEPDCGQTLTSFSLWTEHMLNHHQKNPYHQLESNVRLIHGPYNQYLCNTDCGDQKRCEFVCDSRHLLKLHWNDFHHTGKFQCPSCAFEANLPHKVRDHFVDMFNHVPQVCPYQSCGIKFNNIEAFKGHELRIHARPYKCTWKKCKSTFRTIGLAVSHVRGKHFNLPMSKKEQIKRNIIDLRDPSDYIKKD